MKMITIKKIIITINLVKYSYLSNATCNFPL